jgi:hypothetical protein
MLVQNCKGDLLVAPQKIKIALVLLPGVEVVRFLNAEFV